MKKTLLVLVAVLLSSTGQNYLLAETIHEGTETANVASISGNALEIQTSGYGELETILADYNDAKDITDVVISGALGKADFKALFRYILDKAVSTLDLSGAEIENGEIPDFAFDYYPLNLSDINLATVRLPEGLVRIGEGAFRYAHIKEINFPSTIREIGDEAFNGCALLESQIVLPEGVVKIEKSTFLGCISLKQAPVLPSTLRIIGESAFSHTGFSEITIPENAESIEGLAFSESGIEILRITGQNTALASLAFQGCDLKEVCCNATTPSLAETYAFPADTDATLYIPVGSGLQYRNAPGWNVFRTIIEKEFPTGAVNRVTAENREIPIYDLSGRRIDRPEVGQPYVRNGKTFIQARD